MPEGCPAAEYLWASTASLALSSLLLCCQLWSYTAVLVFSNRLGTGEAADSNPKLSSASTGEAGGTTCTTLPCTVWLGGAESTPVSIHCQKTKKFQASPCRPWPSLQQGVLQSGCLLQQPARLCGSTSCWGGHLGLAQCCSQRTWGSPAVLKACPRGDVLHQDHRLSCTLYHRSCISAAWKDLSWSPVTEATWEPSRPQDKTNRTRGHAVGDPPAAACG